MPVLLQRRFRMCVAKDVQSTQVGLGVLAVTDGSKPPGAALWPEGIRRECTHARGSAHSEWRGPPHSRLIISAI